LQDAESRAWTAAAGPEIATLVPRDVAKSCQTPMLVLPDDVVAHPLQVSIDIASLAPNAEITVYPWKEPPELRPAPSIVCARS